MNFSETIDRIYHLRERSKDDRAKDAWGLLWDIVHDNAMLREELKQYAGLQNRVELLEELVLCQTKLLNTKLEKLLSSQTPITVDPSAP